MAGIYIHIPFCKKACHYCNFFFTTSTRFRETFVPVLIEEIDLRADYLKDEYVSTIYFGGGTPSVLPAKTIQQLIDTISRRFEVIDEPEITLEANPDDLSFAYLTSLKQTQVNRLSIGIQSFHEAELQWMNRAHNSKEAHEALENCKKLGFNKLSLDLIFGIPESTDEKWRYSMEQALEYAPDHLSCYALTVEEKTAYHTHIKQGKSVAPPDELTEKQFYQCRDLLLHRGYEQYEISNYAKPGAHSKHNTAYWEGIPYIGLGPGAHSYDGKNRGWNVNHMVQYIEGIKERKEIFTEELLSKSDRYNEYVMTAIRRKEGIDLHHLFKTHGEFEEHFYHNLKDIPQEYIMHKDGHVTLSPKGLIFADFVGSALFEV